MSIIACAIEECESPSFCKGYCSKHYARYKRHGDPLVTKNRPRPPAGTRSICEVEDCGQNVKGLGFCLKHYQRFKKTGDPLLNPSGRNLRRYGEGELCEADDCGELAIKRGYCGLHYQRLMNHGDVTVTLYRDSCEVIGCERKHFGRGYCSFHLYRFAGTGSPHQMPGGRLPPGMFTTCVVDGCGGNTRGGGGMCGAHAVNFRATGHPLKTPGPAVKSRPCAQCGENMDLTIPSEGRTKATSSKRTCKRCRRDTNLQRHIPALVGRDGTSCYLCGETVDIALAWPHKLSKSVDHVVPWSLGGSDDLSNLSMTHLFCNLQKHNKVPVPALLAS